MHPANPATDNSNRKTPLLNKESNKNPSLLMSVVNIPLALLVALGYASYKALYAASGYVRPAAKIAARMVGGLAAPLLFLGSALALAMKVPFINKYIAQPIAAAWANQVGTGAIVSRALALPFLTAGTLLAVAAPLAIIAFNKTEIDSWFKAGKKHAQDRMPSLDPVKGDSPVKTFLKGKAKDLVGIVGGAANVVVGVTAMRAVFTALAAMAGFSTPAGAAVAAGSTAAFVQGEAVVAASTGAAFYMTKSLGLVSSTGADLAEKATDKAFDAANVVSAIAYDKAAIAGNAAYENGAWAANKTAENGAWAAKAAAAHARAPVAYLRNAYNERQSHLAAEAQRAADLEAQQPHMHNVEEVHVDATVVDGKVTAFKETIEQRRTPSPSA